MSVRRGTVGLTLVEVVVILFIVGLLAILALPAVQRVRASARRSQCQNHLRQIAMAVIAYEAVNQRFPPAAKYLPDPDRPDRSLGHSMYSFLLPHFEEQVVFDQLQFDLDWLDRQTPNAQNQTNYELTHSIHLGGVLECPAAPTVRRHKYTNGDVVDESNQINQTADYAPSWYLDARLTASQMSDVTRRLDSHGLLQVIPLWELVPDTIRDAVRGTPTRATDLTQNQRWWGVLRKQIGERPVVVRPAHVRDGLSCTFLLFEAAGRPDHFVSRQPVDADIMGTNTQGLRWGSPDLALKLDEACEGDQLINCHNWDNIYAFHQLGAMVAFADGAVEFMGQDVDPELFVSLYTISGRDMIGESKR